jgi:hypothetical protein
VLSFNAIEVLDGLGALVRLQTLDASFNKILSLGVRGRSRGPVFSDTDVVG